jgi:hypothetical protein
LDLAAEKKEEAVDPPLSAGSRILEGSPSEDADFSADSLATRDGGPHRAGRRAAGFNGRRGRRDLLLLFRLLLFLLLLLFPLLFLALLLLVLGLRPAAILRPSSFSPSLSS